MSFTCLIRTSGIMIASLYSHEAFDFFNVLNQLFVCSLNVHVRRLVCLCLIVGSF